MLRLRPYKPCDAQSIASWCSDERTLRRWSADRFGEFPVTAEDINEKYLKFNGDCSEPDNFYPMTAFDETGAVGHFIMRFVDEEKRTLRLGFVIVDDAKRGRGYGREMIGLALKFAFEMICAEKVTIGVFDTNPAAFRCYTSAGLTEAAEYEKEALEFFGEKWGLIELEMTAEEYEKRYAAPSAS